MARRYARSTSRRSTGRSYASRGRAAPRKTHRSRAGTGRRTTARRGSGRGSQTIRIEVVQPQSNPVARPEIGLKPADAPRKSMF